MFNIFFPENRGVNEIMWKNTVQTDRPQMSIYYGAWDLRAGELRVQTHTQNILIAFARQKWFHERPSRCVTRALLVFLLLRSNHEVSLHTPRLAFKSRTLTVQSISPSLTNFQNSWHEHSEKRC